MANFTLKSLNAEVLKAARAVFSGAPDGVRFTPLLDLRLGVAGTDYCLRLARRYHAEPAALAARIISSLPEELRTLCAIEDGYLNVRCPADLHGWSFCPEEVEEENARAYCIFLPPATERIQGVPYLRLCAQAALQAFILCQDGHTVSILLSGELLKPGATELNLIGILRSMIALSSRVERNWQASGLSRLQSFLAEHSAEKIFLWLSADSLERTSFQRFYREQIQNSEYVELRCPAQIWLSYEGNGAACHELLNWSDEELCCLCYYLALPLHGASLDLAVPRLQERANLLWYFKSCQERIDRACSLLSAQHMAAPAGLELESAGWLTSPATQRLLFRLKYLNVARAHAGVCGTVSRFLGIFEDFLASISCVLNSPDFRFRMDQNLLAAVEGRVLIDVGQILSNMIQRCGCRIK